MLRKWEHIAKALENLKAPAEITGAARKINEALIALGITYNTPAWVEYYSNYPDPDKESWVTLKTIIFGAHYCSACTTEAGIDINCGKCKLRGGADNNTDYDIIMPCTPESLYGVNLYEIVSEFVERKVFDLTQR